MPYCCIAPSVSVRTIFSGRIAARILSIERARGITLARWQLAHRASKCASPLMSCAATDPERKAAEVADMNIKDEQVAHRTPGLFGKARFVIIGLTAIISRPNAEETSQRR